MTFIALSVKTLIILFIQSLLSCYYYKTINQSKLKPFSHKLCVFWRLVGGAGQLPLQPHRQLVQRQHLLPHDSGQLGEGEQVPVRDVAGRSTARRFGPPSTPPLLCPSLLTFSPSSRPSGLQDGRPDHLVRQHVLPREAGLPDGEPALRDVRR